MPKFPKTIEDLIVQLGTLPGVGPKTAERYAFALLKRGRMDRERLAAAIIAPDSNLTACTTCRNYTESDPCAICTDPKRDRDLVCVVATEQDLLAIESTAEYRGLYHVLGGLLSPADGVTPRELTVRELEERVRSAPPREIIFALDPTVEGESTTLYLTRMLAPHAAGAGATKMTRLARGLPIGSEVGYADEVTLSDAIAGRREVAAPRGTAAALGAAAEAERAAENVPF
ncbi:MAG: recombination protein RecR [Candidatus Parcubacteria bacterium]|jgi:recombination protein RecR